MSTVRFERESVAKDMIAAVKGLSSEYGSAYAVATYEGRILSLKNPELSFYFAKEYEPYADVASHEQVVIDSKSPKWNTLWVYTFPTRRLYEHATIVGESKKPSWNYFMAVFFKDKTNVAYTGYFRQNVYESGSVKWNYMTAQTFRGVENIEPHRQVVLNSTSRRTQEYRDQLQFDDEILGTPFVKKYPEGKQ